MSDSVNQSTVDALRAARDAVTSDIRTALEERRQLETRLRELIDLAEKLTAQLGEDDLPPVLRTADESRVDAISRVLEGAGEPISPGAIQEELASEGRVESRKDVSSALSYLAGKGRARRVGDASWESVT